MNITTLMMQKLSACSRIILSSFCKKGIYNPSFISIERFNIVEWEDVEEEVKNLIENYLNSEKEVISEVKKRKIIPYQFTRKAPLILQF